jgi:hypothetical protein
MEEWPFRTARADANGEHPGSCNMDSIAANKIGRGTWPYGRLGILTRRPFEVNRAPLISIALPRLRGAVTNTSFVRRSGLCAEDRWGYNEIQRDHKVRPCEGIRNHEETQSSGKHAQ